MRYSRKFLPGRVGIHFLEALNDFTGRYILGIQEEGFVSHGGKTALVFFY